MRLLVTYLNGTVSELSGVASAVVYHDEMAGASSEASSTAGEQFCLPIFSDKTNTSRIIAAGGDEQRGDGVGLGKIGGVGERKDRGEEAGREKGNPSIYKMVFHCSDGKCLAPVEVLDLAVSKYGEQTTHEECVKANQWLIANPNKKRKRKGLGTFLNKWFERASEYRAQRRKINSGNLLNEETTDQTW